MGYIIENSGRTEFWRGTTGSFAILEYSSNTSQSRHVLGCAPNLSLVTVVCADLPLYYVSERKALGVGRIASGTSFLVVMLTLAPAVRRAPNAKIPQRSADHTKDRRRECTDYYESQGSLAVFWF
jgi:hypothetical protein